MMGDDDGFYARNATTNVDWGMVEFMRAYASLCVYFFAIFYP